jgi:periodic tryptophan protein 2
VEPFQLNADVLSLAFRPDGQELVVSTLDGQLTFFSTSLSKQTNVIEGRKDISGGRKADDRVAASNSASSKAFTSVAWSADGSCVLAGGNSKYVALYDSREGVLIRRWQISKTCHLTGPRSFWIVGA